MTGIFNESLTIRVDDSHMLHIVERPGGFQVEIEEGNFWAAVGITTGMAVQLATWIMQHNAETTT